MRKTILLISICLGILLLFTACLKEAPTSETPENPIASAASEEVDGQYVSGEMRIRYYDFTKAVNVSDSIYIGEYISRELTDWGDYHYAFKVKEVWRGEIPEETA
ncbi:MAG: hypothetical protein LBM28_01140, partial [Oscillospiraceae bacterium]|nr:hypothetical protein [Oscillospiraceae bacterium]